MTDSEGEVEVTARPIWDVCQAIKNIIPSTLIKKPQIVAKIEKVERDAGYTAPEAMYIRWEQLVRVLQEEIGPPKLEWQLTIARVASAREDYKKFLEKKA